MIEGKNKVGAGFVVFNIAKPDLMLVLIRDDGKYDIPKGVIDKGETEFAAALRETFEECSILIEPQEMLSKEPSLKDGRLTTYCAMTHKIPQITPNPHSGKFEHKDHEWVTKEKALSNCLPYLSRHIEAAYFLKVICGI